VALYTEDGFGYTAVGYCEGTEALEVLAETEELLNDEKLAVVDAETGLGY
jgi:hypothetical protein